MEAFARASGDVNPVHLPGSPASDSPFEAPIVYGVLAALAAVGEVAEERDRGLHGLEATFLRPLRVGVEYDLDVRRDRQRLTACIRDGDLPALKLDARFSGGGVLPAVGPAERLEQPRRCRIEDLAPGASASGGYAGDEESIGWLRERFGLGTPTVSDGLLHALLHASYLVGMVMPGSGSLLSRLRVALAGTAPVATGGGLAAEPLSYRATVVDLQPEVRTVTLAGDLRRRDELIARLTCEAHVPPPPAPLDLGLLEKELRRSSGLLQGRTALVVGGGGRLGAALVHGLASQGCSVYTCSRSGAEREVSARWRGAIHDARGDASDPDHCRRLVRRVVDRHGGLDLLLCCAAPRLEGIGFGPTSVGRFNDFVQRSVELVSVPMATTIEALEEKGGTCLVVSSEAVKTMPREWGHYVAAKGAVEALAVWAARRSPGVGVLVARVPRLDRETLGGGEDAVARELVAAWLIRRLSSGLGTGGTHLLEWP